MAIKLREFRVLDRSVKMIVLFVLGFFSSWACLRCADTRKEGTFITTNARNTKKSTIAQNLATVDFTKLCFIQSFTRGKWWIR